MAPRAEDGVQFSMFAPLLGTLSRPPLDPDATNHELVAAAVRAQEGAGLEPITDGGQAGTGSPVELWREAASLTTRAVKCVVTGPYTTGLGAALGDGRGAARGVDWAAVRSAAVR